MRIKTLSLAAVMLGSLWMMGGTAHAAIPCPEGMSAGTVVIFTNGGAGGTGLEGTPGNTGLRCSKDGTLMPVTTGRFADPGASDPGASDEGDEFRDIWDDPCAGGWIYAYFVGGYFHCSKDGHFTYHLNA